MKLSKKVTPVWHWALGIYVLVGILIGLLEHFSKARMGFMRYVVFMNHEMSLGVLNPLLINVWSFILLTCMGYMLVTRKTNAIDRFLTSIGCGLAAVAINTEVLNGFKSTGFIKLLLLMAALILMFRVGWQSFSDRFMK